MNDEKILTSAHNRLEAFLKSRGLRRTPEREAVLNCIFSTPEHFYIEQVHKALGSAGHRISLATVYNTVQLLIEAGLVRRHQFSNMSPQYERVLHSHTASSHLHLVCTSCGQVKELKDSHITAAIHEKRFPAFAPEYFTLYVYGLCSKCQRRIRKESNR